MTTDPPTPDDRRAVIPTLDLATQATGLVSPVTKWGTIRRSAPMPGTYHFYTHDYKFSALAKHPDGLAASRCVVAVEVNFSTYRGMPMGRVLDDVRKKMIENIAFVVPRDSQTPRYPRGRR